MKYLLQKHSWLLAIWCIVSAFGAYACMYGFRKPFTAADFSEASYGMDFKVWLVSAQVIGYTLSKWIGIKIVSEMTPARRVRMLIGLIAVAEVALLLFAITPAPWSAFWLFCNGIPLGMVFGLILGFLEGRKMTELFVSGLCVSFILADGFTKSVGTWLLGKGISDAWMPVTAGALFLLPLIIFVAMLSIIPAPDSEDVALRSERVPMTREQRRKVIYRHSLALAGIFIAYLLITVLRSLRADFAPEIWSALGYVKAPDLFIRSELWVGLAVMVASASMVLFRNNLRAYRMGLVLCIVGACLGVFSIYAMQRGWISGFQFMCVLGVGMYVPYVVIHTSLFERFVASTREKANMGFLMYIADAIGYLGYCCVMIVSGILKRNKADFWSFFTTTSNWLLIVSVIALSLALLYSLCKKSVATDADSIS